MSSHVPNDAEAHDRKRLEQLCRHVTQPALSDVRVQINASVPVEWKLKTPWRDGTTHLVMSPLESMRFFDAETKKWAAVVNASGAKMD